MIARVTHVQGNPDELAEKYERARGNMEQRGLPGLPPGLRVHVASKAPDGFRVANVWDSEEQADAAWNRPEFQESLREAGINADEMRIEQLEVVNVLTQ